MRPEIEVLSWDSWFRDQICNKRIGKNPEEAIWSGSTLFVIQFVNLYEQTTSSDLIGWKSEIGVANLVNQQDKG